MLFVMKQIVIFQKMSCYFGFSVKKQNKLSKFRQALKSCLTEPLLELVFETLHHRVDDVARPRKLARVHLPEVGDHEEDQEHG